MNGVDTTPEFAADSTMAYRNKQEYSRLVRGDGFSFAEYNVPSRELELAPNAWSPDSRYVLGVDSEMENGRYVSRTYRAYSLMATNSAAWERKLGPNSDVQWAGEGRLFVYNGQKAEFINLSTGAITEARSTLQECCVLSFSPDGQYAVVRQGDGAAWEQRCAVINVASGREIATVPPAPADQGTVFCGATSWLDDGSSVLVSAGGT
jgi:hypothetical protein